MILEVCISRLLRVRIWYGPQGGALGRFSCRDTWKFTFSFLAGRISWMHVLTQNLVPEFTLPSKLQVCSLVAHDAWVLLRWHIRCAQIIICMLISMLDLVLYIFSLGLLRTILSSHNLIMNSLSVRVSSFHLKWHLRHHWVCYSLVIKISLPYAKFVFAKSQWLIALCCIFWVL